MVFVLVCAMRTHDYFVSEFDPFIPLHIALPPGAVSPRGQARGGWVNGATQSGSEYSLAFLTDTMA